MDQCPHAGVGSGAAGDGGRAVLEAAHGVSRVHPDAAHRARFPRHCRVAAGPARHGMHVVVPPLDRTFLLSRTLPASPPPFYTTLLRALTPPDLPFRIDFVLPCHSKRTISALPCQFEKQSTHASPRLSLAPPAPRAILALPSFPACTARSLASCPTYMVLLSVITLVFLAFTIFSFTVSEPGHGTPVNGLEFQQYYLDSYSKWMQSTLRNAATWDRVQACMVDAAYCQQLNLRYPDLSQYHAAQLSPTESGCCRPPIECGYRQMTATIFMQEGPPHSDNPDCTKYSAVNSTMCFACDSCRAGVAEYVKSEWMKVAYLLLAFTIILMSICVFGCCATYHVEVEEEEPLELEMLAKPSRHKPRRRVTWA
ncbi:unnamed protein product [Closterium sp. Yama58-4]|nr:unnamed protein product [Closterium sp. Yama58-4]